MLHDTIRREAYLLRFSWAVQDFPQYVRLKRELRTEIDAAAAEVGMKQAIVDLGHPRVLADSYLSDLGRSVPRWTTGGYWALAVGVAVVALWMAYGLGCLHTLDQNGGGTSTASFLGTTTTYTSSDGSISAGVALGWQFIALAAAVLGVPFLLGARFWRLWSGAPGARVATTAQS